jgi:putative membrane protein insertion efficiency factor
MTRWISHILGKTLIFLVLLYRVTLGKVMGGHCRFQPSCSQYMIDAVQKHGPVRGAWRGLKRIARCHPFGGSGYDPA